MPKSETAENRAKQWFTPAQQIVNKCECAALKTRREKARA